MISISPGHYGPRTGANDLIDEVTEAIKVSKEVARILRASGITTNYIEDNVSKSQSANLGWLVKQHNQTNRQFDVSVHFNASPGTHDRGIGTEVLYVNHAVKGIAEQVSSAIAKAAGFINRGAKHRMNLGFLNGTTKKALLIEVCFVNSKTDVELYRKNFDAICYAIASELAKAVGKPIKSDKKEEATVTKETYEKDAAPSAWAKEAVEWAKKNNISDGTYLKRAATREEMIVMLHRMRNLK